MTEIRAGLLEMLEGHYRSSGWKATRSDRTVEASGPGGVTWIGRPVVAEDVESEDFETELVSLADRRMPAGGELCPLDLLPDERSEPALRELLDRTGLSRRPHVSVYSLAA